MESLYLLIPLSVVLVLLIGAVLAWAVLTGQFDDLEAEGRRILDEGSGQGESGSLDAGQTGGTAP